MTILYCKRCKNVYFFDKLDPAEAAAERCSNFNCNSPLTNISVNHAGIGTISDLIFVGIIGTAAKCGISLLFESDTIPIVSNNHMVRESCTLTAQDRETFDQLMAFLSLWETNHSSPFITHNPIVEQLDLEIAFKIPIEDGYDNGPLPTTGIDALLTASHGAYLFTKYIKEFIEAYSEGE